MQHEDGAWYLNDTPLWEWWSINYRIAEEIDPYAELKAAAKDPMKQIRYRVNGVWLEWLDSNTPGGLAWSYPPEDYEIRDKPDPYAEFKAAAKDPTKQIRTTKFGGTEWKDAGFEWTWSSPRTATKSATSRSR